MMEQRSERLTKRDVLLFTCAVVTLVAALGFGVAGFIVSPTGEVHDSVLWLIAQLLLFTASAFGLGAYTNMSTRETNHRFRTIERQLRNFTGRGHRSDEYEQYAEEDFNNEEYEDEDSSRQGSRTPTGG